MLKILFDKDMKAADEWLKVSPGVFIQHPKQITSKTTEQAQLVNETMQVLSLYLTQYYYKDLSKTPSLSGMSALLLEPFSVNSKDDGVIYLDGHRNHESVLTDTLMSQLDDELKKGIKTIRAITRKTDKSSGKATNLVTSFSSIAQLGERDINETRLITNRLSIQTPDFAIVQMFDRKQQNAKALMIGLYLLGHDVSNLSPRDVMASLSNALSTLRLYTKESASADISKAIEKSVMSIIEASKKDPAFTEKCKSIVTSLICKNWRDHSVVYDIYWAQDKIGNMVKLAESEVIKLLSGTMYSWGVSTNKETHSLPIPKILDGVTPYFPPAVSALLPERLSEDLKKHGPLTIDKMVLESKPYLLGCLYFYDRSKGGIPHNPLSSIETSLDDVCDGLIFKPDTSLIDLNQEISMFEQFSHEISNKSCRISIPGFQLKAPVNISRYRDKTVMRFAEPHNFTHIIKFPTNKDDKSGMVYAELFGMTCALACGVDTAKFKAVQTNIETVKDILPSDKFSNKSILDDIVSTGEPSFITELFDRPLEGQRKRFMNEDFMSSSKEIHKYNVMPNKLIEILPALYPKEAESIIVDTIYADHGVEALIAVVKARSTHSDLDTEKLFRQLIVNTVVGNGDAHLKNFSLLHESDETGTLTVRLSPAYDIVSTRVLAVKFFKQEGCCMIGRTYNPSRNAVIRSGVEQFGLTPGRAASILDDVVDRATLFFNSTVHTKEVNDVFNNTLLGKEILGKCLTYGKMQLSALSVNTMNPDVGVDDSLLFTKLYPNESYDYEFGYNGHSMSEPLMLPLPSNSPENFDHTTDSAVRGNEVGVALKL